MHGGPHIPNGTRGPTWYARSMKGCLSCASGLHKLAVTFGGCGTSLWQKSHHKYTMLVVNLAIPPCRHLPHVVQQPVSQKHTYAGVHKRTSSHRHHTYATAIAAGGRPAAQPRRPADSCACAGSPTCLPAMWNIRVACCIRGVSVSSERICRCRIECETWAAWRRRAAARTTFQELCLTRKKLL